MTTAIRHHAQRLARQRRDMSCARSGRQALIAHLILQAYFGQKAGRGTA
jgi:hypothetical protein